MNKFKILLLIFSIISCTKTNKNCCETKEDLASTVITSLKENNIEQYKKVFMPLSLDSIPVSRNNDLSIEEYKNGVIRTYVDSQNEFSKEGYDIKDFEIIDVEEFDPNYNFKYYDDTYNGYKFNIILADSKNNYVKAEIKCVKIKDQYFFRDDITLKN